MSGPERLHSGTANRLTARSKEEWEDWEDDEVLTPITTRDGPLLDVGSGYTGSASGEAAGQPGRQASQRTTSGTAAARQSVQKIRRLKSRHRQKAQNARAGIKLVTDMSKFRQQQQQQQHIAQQMRATHEKRETTTGKFVDAAALKALEGIPPDDEDSLGNVFGWLKRRPTKGKRAERLAAEAPPQVDLSPSAGPIVIGFAMPSDSDVVISPQTAVVETPMEFPQCFKPGNTVSPSQPVSAWSPDTEDGASPRVPERGYVPAVPSIPRHYQATEGPLMTENGREGGLARARSRKDHRDTLTTPIYASDDEDMATPVTLFEEDGSPATAKPRSLKVKGRQRSATAGSSRSQGWWDQVTSPFGPPTPATPQSTSATQGAAAGGSQAWWKDLDKKKPLSPSRAQPTAESSRAPGSTAKLQRRPPEIIIEDVSSAPEATSREIQPPLQSPPQPEKPRAMAEIVRSPGELPPPYSPPSSKHNIRYRAVFPPGHPLNDMFPPSPGPVPPGLSQTMTSQGAIGLADVPLTPPPVAQSQRLPDRPLGSFVPDDHYLDASGHGPRQKAERQRRRHEKEDVVAWKAGRLFHGRGCFPCCGCFGRPGREGRKRRRVCLGVCIVMLLLTALGVSLGVVLSRHAAADASMPSQWLNLTNFPPIPTGISTVIGPDSDSKTACVQPPTLWACSLPKEQASSVAPFDASQPSFVFQIQFDNSTQQLWKTTGVPPQPTPTGRGATLAQQPSNITNASPPPPASRFRRLVTGDRDNAGSSSSLDIRPVPPPPTFQEMFFLGNTTDGVVSNDKAGEPTPFYVSMLHSVNDTAGPNLLSRRQSSNATTDGQGVLNASDIAPPPALGPDGKGAPAVLLGFPTQQPLRLYDRGLPTERYSFYTYFNKTTYVKSVDALLGNGASSTPVPADQNGGSLESEARFLVTWLSVRYKVEIWTRTGNTTRLVGSGNGGGPASGNGTQPGTMPYPVTVTLDTHGGSPGRKFAFVRGVDERGHVVLDDARFVLNQMNTTGDLVNPAGDFNPSLGGMDGGTGGCRCEYRNWVAVNRRG